jgi:uncharacterized membrane protein
MEALERYDVSPETAWVGALAAIVVTIAAAALAFPARVYDEFIWRYFIGPVRVDATTADCLIYDTGTGEVREVVTDGTTGSCTAGAGEFVVTEGYTVTSTVGYILILVFMLAGVYLFLERFDLDPLRGAFYALFPFILFGGALRTVEDAFIAALEAGQTPGMEYPASAALISPFIYFTVFAIALVAFFVSKWLERQGQVENYTRPFGLIGVAVLLPTFGYLVLLSITEEYIRLYPGILLAILGIATVSAVITYFAVDAQWPSFHAGTGLMGLVVIWAHAVDGVANVLANDWTHLWHGFNYGAKHPFNQLVMDLTGAIQGGEYVAGVYVGEAWPFFLVKLAAPVLILSLFDDEFMEDSPRFSVLLLGVVVAIGLGPGTRDMIRVAFAI